MIKKRWLCLFVENEIGVLARISGLFSGKAYNLDSLTVGITEDKTISRMTIGLTSNDKTFEQIKKQLNRSVEVIRVVDYTDVPIHLKEVMFIKIEHCDELSKNELFRMTSVFSVTIIDYNFTTVILECIQSEAKNTQLVQLLQTKMKKSVEIVRGGSVAIKATSLIE